MPAKNYERIPLLLETEALAQVTEAAKKSGINRTKLIRMMVKFALGGSRLEDVLKFGDPPTIKTS